MTYHISTHTLTWSVTFFLCQNQHDIKYFNSHAHVERDRLLKVCACGDIHFNSHAHVERDGSNPAPATNKEISTHTLTWSVTAPTANRVSQTCDFNSHAHVERDMRGILIGAIHKNFNSHAHVERDPLHYDYVLHAFHFNSHAHVERDSISLCPS